LCWWIYLYLLTVIPWQSIAIDDARYNQAYNVICTFENLVFVAGAIVLSAKRPADGAASTRIWPEPVRQYTFGSLLVTSRSTVACIRREFVRSADHRVAPLAGNAGVTAYSSGSETSTGETKETEEKSSGSAPRSEASDVALGASGLLSLPLLGIGV